jgi:hypothetical protein
MNASQDMSCAELESLLRAAERNGSDAETLESISRHLDGCEICSRAESWLTTAVERYRQDFESPLGDEFENTLLNQLCVDR